MEKNIDWLGYYYEQLKSLIEVDPVLRYKNKKTENVKYKQQQTSASAGFPIFSTSEMDKLPVLSSYLLFQ